MGVPSPIVLMIDMFRCELVGREIDVSLGDALGGVGLSRDVGRIGGSIRTSRSVDFERNKEPFERLAGCCWLSPGDLAFLLNVRHTEATFDSGSDLLFSRLNPPNPNRFLSDEAFELQDPVLLDRSFLE